MEAARCLNPKCRRPLPGKPLMMNTDTLRELPRDQAAGDIGICAACGRIMIFTGVGNMVRNPSPDEANLIGSDKEVMEIRQAILNRLVKEPRR